MNGALPLLAVNGSIELTDKALHPAGAAFLLIGSLAFLFALLCALRYSYDEPFLWRVFWVVLGLAASVAIGIGLWLI